MTTEYLNLNEVHIAIMTAAIYIEDLVSARLSLAAQAPRRGETIEDPDPLYKWSGYENICTSHSVQYIVPGCMQPTRLASLVTIGTYPA